MSFGFNSGQEKEGNNRSMKFGESVGNGNSFGKTDGETKLEDSEKKSQIRYGLIIRYNLKDFYFVFTSTNMLKIKSEIFKELDMNEKKFQKIGIRLNKNLIQFNEGFIHYQLIIKKENSIKIEFVKY